MYAAEPARVLPPPGFYTGPEAAARIMRAAHFPDEVLSLLQLEGVTVFDALVRYRCDSIVELGCYDGRALEISRLAGVRYLGVDLDAAAVAELCGRIAVEGLEDRAGAVVADALEPEEWTGRIGGGRTLVHLPFNFLGGFPEPELLLRPLAAIPDALLLACVFNCGELATLVRERYYTACGVAGLRCHRDSSGGVTYTGANHFYSQAFTPALLADLLARCGLTALWEAANRIGFCVVTRAEEGR